MPDTLEDLQRDLDRAQLTADAPAIADITRRMGRVKVPEPAAPPLSEGDKTNSSDATRQLLALVGELSTKVDQLIDRQVVELDPATLEAGPAIPSAAEVADEVVARIRAVAEEATAAEDAGQKRGGKSGDEPPVDPSPTDPAKRTAGPTTPTRKG